LCTLSTSQAGFWHGAHGSLQGVQGNDTGGIIPWSCENEAVAKEIAGNHCAYYYKYPRITSVSRQYGGYIGFHCLWRPGIDRFAIPAVSTGDSCRVYRRRHRIDLQLK
jgi:hypothetical protein